METLSQARRGSKSALLDNKPSPASNKLSSRANSKPNSKKRRSRPTTTQANPCPSTRLRSTHAVTSIDSEWESTEWVSSQFYTTYQGKSYREIFIRADVPDDIKARLTAQGERLAVRVNFIERTDDMNLWAEHYAHIQLENPCIVTGLMFYSPKDLEYALGWDMVKTLYIAGTRRDKKGRLRRRKLLTQKRNVRGSFQAGMAQITIHDLKGWAPGSLKKLADSVGYTFASKNALDNYKDKMFKALLEYPETFLEYAMGDVEALPAIKALYIASVNKVRSIIGLPDTETLPYTTGSLVAQSFEEWLYSLAKSPTHFRFCTRFPLGITQSDNTMFLPFLNASADSIKERCHALDNDPNTQDKAIKTLLNTPMIQDGLMGSSVKYFGSVKGDTSIFNAITQGGRCVNERPTECRVELGADIDLQSCYGSALRKLYYPIGLPRVIAFTGHQERITLGEFLFNYEPELVDNLWTAIVNTTRHLTFEQDLIFSKLVTESTISDAVIDSQYIDREQEASTVSGMFCLLRREIINGVITSDVLNALRKVSTNQEYKEIKNLELVSAVFYARSDRVKTVEEWIEKVSTSPGRRLKRNNGYGPMVDNRTNIWVGISLEPFIGKLVDARTPLKTRKKDNTSTEEQRTTAKAEDEALKLFINTTYGTIASPYFPISNTVISNNITAKARVGAWQISKALHTRQTITDGGFYGLMAVPFITGDKKPGLASLSDQLSTHQLRTPSKLQPLAGINWTLELELSKTSLTINVKNLDALATKHISEFWARYGMELLFNIEHKLENTFTTASYINKADYLIIRLDGTELFKVRGAKEYDDEDLTPSPKYKILRTIVAGNDTHPENLQYDHTALQKVSAWCKGLNTPGSPEQRPGDAVRMQRTLRINNTHTAINTVSELRHRVQRALLPGPLYERHASEGIQSVIERLNQDIL